MKEKLPKSHPHRTNPKGEKMFIVKIMTLPNHVVFYYELPAGTNHAASMPLDSNFLSIRLTGRWHTSVADPDGILPANEREQDLDAPSVHRAGQTRIKATVTTLTDGSVICIYPKEELSKIMGPRRVAFYSNAPPYTIVKVFQG
jgi:hypothetical protein